MQSDNNVIVFKNLENVKETVKNTNPTTTKIKHIRNTKMDCSESVDEYISRTDWRVNANANTGYSHAGLINNLAGKAIANFWLDEVYSNEEAKAHREADYHIHDLDLLSSYCAGWSLRQLLTEGFNGVQGRTSSRPPAHFREALGQMSNFLGILQAEWAGAQAFSSFDTYLAPYVFKDQLSDAEITKAIRQFVYNLNVPARWGQSPFTNITLDINVPKDLKNDFPMRGTEHLFAEIHNKELLGIAKQRRPDIQSLSDMTYGDFTSEMERIVIAYYNVMTEGDATGQPFTFPIPTVNITEDFKWDSNVADAIFANAAKFGCSYFQNFIGSQFVVDENGNKSANPNAFHPDDVRSMCCRLRLDLRELRNRGNGLFGSAEMTGSIGVVTINLARLGYRFKGNEAGLIKELDKLMDLAKSTLEKKRVFANDMLARGLYPYTKRYLGTFEHHFNTIGINGMNEMLLNFSNGVLDMTKESGIEIALKILDHMRSKLSVYQEETGNLYNLEATPGEGTTYRFAKEDLKKYPDIIQAGKFPNVYYTNSSQLPVGFTDDPFEALNLQNKVQTKYTGGTVVHLYMSERLQTTDSCKKLVKTALENYQLPYITISPVFSICEDHGYLNGEQACCPKCGKKSTIWSRVTGYFRPVDSFNIGKIGEHRERKFFKEDVAQKHTT